MSYDLERAQLGRPTFVTNDSKYDKFRYETGHVTNISDESKLPAYRAAIAAYALTHPETKLHIGEGYKHTKHGLYKTSGPCDLSEFWRIFDECRKTPADTLDLMTKYAARYDFLRNGNWTVESHPEIKEYLMTHVNREALDRVVDAAIAKQKEIQ